MDFNKFDSVTAAEKGAECHLKHPATLQPLFDNPKDPFKDNGKPCVVILMGAEAPSVRAATRELQKARALAKPEAESDSDQDSEFTSYDELHERMVENLVPRVLGFKNVRKGEKAATKEDAAWFFNLNRFNGQVKEKSFVEQAGDFSSSRVGYLGNASAG